MQEKRLLAMAVLGAGLWVAAGLGSRAQALTITTTTGSFSAAVTDDSGATVSVTNPTNSGSATDSTLSNSTHSGSFTRFDSTTGVLTQVAISLGSTLQHRLSGDSGNRSPSASSATATGTGTTNLTLSETAGGASSATTLTATGACSQSGSGASGCPGNPGYDTGNVTATLNSSLTISSPGSLNSYVGGGSYTATATIPSITATTADVNFVSSEATYQLGTWAGDFTRTYTYLLHALPSLASGVSPTTTLLLDFGTVTQGSGGGSLSQAFGIFNLTGGQPASDRVGLDLDGFVETGDGSNRFSSDLAGFTNLGAGSSNPFSLTFLTSTLGLFTATYTLTLSDQNIGASSTWDSFSLTLNVQGNIIPAPPVPAPPALALLVAAGALVGGARLARRARRGRAG